MDGIIFDIDGTLWDSRESVAHAWREVLEEEGIEMEVTVETITPLFGKTDTEIEEALFSHLPMSKEERAGLMERCFQREGEHLRKNPGILYEGVEEMLQTLSDKYPLFLVSNCNKGYAETMMETTGLGPFFADHLCFGDTLKPKGDNIRTIAKTHGLKAPIYIGDTQGDLQACREAGVPMIYVSYGLGHADAPDFTADSTEEVCRIILEQ